jgi:hypothetical protein
MSTFPNSPRLLKGGIVLVDPDTAAVRRIISLQYFPDTVTRSLQIQGVSAEGGGDRSEILRLKGPPVETIKLMRKSTRRISSSFRIRTPTQFEVGIHPQLAALEAIVISDQRTIAVQQRAREIRYARDHPDAVCAYPIYLEQEPDHPDASDRF